eukprot:TRINITY_DN3996_c0_g1_i1.p1 TRINITY_DN3996_c0_g1~~TRINITY_DN3996_c0_g1_i1.p1  ORF type:complete len:521 (+),score=89.90 TRINITY_DN3996_c0_g1_i1:38-1564(+)
MSAVPRGDITDSDDDDDLPAFLHDLKEKSWAMFARQTQVPAILGNHASNLFPPPIKFEPFSPPAEPKKYKVFDALSTNPNIVDDGYVKPTYKTIYPEDFEVVADPEEHVMITRGKSGTKTTKKKSQPANPPNKKRKITTEKVVAVYRGRVLEDRRSARIAKKKGRPATRRPTATVATRAAPRKVSLTLSGYDSGADSGASDGSEEEYEDEGEPSGGRKRKKAPAKRSAAKSAKRKPARSRSPKRKTSTAEEDSASSVSNPSSAAVSVPSSSSAAPSSFTSQPMLDLSSDSDSDVKRDKDDEEDWQIPDEPRQERRKKPVKGGKKKARFSRRRLSSVDHAPVKMRRKRYYTTEETKKCAVCMRAATSMPRIPCSQCGKPVCPMCRSKDEQAICPTCWVDNTRSAESADRLKVATMKGTWTEEELRILVSKVRSTRPQKLKNLGFDRWVDLLTALDGRTVSGVWKTLYRSGEVGSVYQSILDEEVRSGRVLHNGALESPDEEESGGEDLS